MLDIQFIRENSDAVARAIEHKRVSLRVDDLLAVDRKRIEIQQELDALKAEKNQLNEKIATASPEKKLLYINEGKQIKEKLDALDPMYRETEERYQEMMLCIPNIPSEDTPIGEDESGNVVLRQVGEIPEFSAKGGSASGRDFKPKEHWEAWNGT